MNYKKLKQWLLEYEGADCDGCDESVGCKYAGNCDILCPKDADLIIAKIKELEND